MAERLGLPLAWPRPDPVVGDRESGDDPGEQPLVRWITALCVAAAEQGRGLEYYAEVARLMWGGEVNGWHEGRHLADAAGRAGLDFEQLSEAVSRNPDRFHAITLDNERAQRDAGHHGAPLLVLEGEPFYGQDRFEDFKWRLAQKGLLQDT